jgi:hypothetical protein
MIDYSNYTPAGLLARIKDLGQELDAAKNALTRTQQYCQHTWTEPKYDPVVRDGYQFQGDPPPEENFAARIKMEHIFSSCSAK